MNQVQEAIRRIARERGVSLADARRVLIEQIDYQRRIRINRGGMVVTPESGEKKQKVNLANPHRKHVETEIKDPKVEVSPGRLAALAAHRDNRSQEYRDRVAQQEREREQDREARATETREFTPRPFARVGRPRLDGETPGETDENKSRRNVPVPGSMTSIIFHEMMDEEKDFNLAYKSLRNMHTFDHLDDQKLRQRMREVAWRYDVPLKSFASQASQEA